MSLLTQPQVQIASKIYSTASQILLPILIALVCWSGIKNLEVKALNDKQATVIQKLENDKSNLTSELQKAKDQVTQLSEDNLKAAADSAAAKDKFDKDLAAAKQSAKNQVGKIADKWKNQPVSTTADEAINKLRNNAIGLKVEFVGADSGSK